MNRLKSMFIGIYPMIAMGIVGSGIYRMIQHGFDPGWFGAMFTAMPILMFFGRAMIFKSIPRTSAHFPLLTFMAVIGLALAVVNFIQSSMTHPQALFAASIGFAGYMLYNFWFSKLGRERDPLLQQGQLLPSFTALDVTGETFFSESLKGKPAVLLFFRGNWCPLCMAQIKEVAAKYRELARHGVTVALISPQPEKNTQELAARFDVPFLFLTDKENKAARTLGIEMKNGLPAGMEMLGYDKDTVLPTVIVTDASGRILYSDETNNYRIRPEPDEYIKVLDAHLQSV